MKKLYRVIAEDRDNAYKLYIPANSKRDAEKWANGNGEIIDVRDVTADFPISIDKVVDALKTAGFGQIECDIIMRLVEDYSNAQ